MKRGQVLGQPFIYMFYVIVAVLVLLIGAKWIAGVIDTGDSVEYSVFINDLEGKVDQVYSDNYGSVVYANSISIPEGIGEICIMDHSLEQNFSSVLDETLATYMNITSSYSDSDNVYFSGEELSYGFIPLLVLESSPLCDGTSDGSFDVKFFNNGTGIIARLI